MKRMIFLVVFAALTMIIGTASAATAMITEGAMVSAEVNATTGEAVVTLSGVDVEDIEFYAYEGVKHLGAKDKFTVKLWDGRRFNFKFKNGKYALLTPEMKGHAFFGPGTGLDCSNPNGCVILITGK